MPDLSVGINVITFGVNMSSSVHIDKTGKVNAKTQYSNKYSNIQYSNATKMYKFKAKDCEVKKNQLRLGNISGHVSANNITRSRIKQMFV